MSRIVLDTETTGLLAPSAAELFAQPHITQIYLAKLNKKLEIIEDYESLVKPPIPIPEIITKITGISDETVRNSPSFPEIYRHIQSFFLGSKLAIGQNTTFDMEVLQHEIERIGFEFHFPWPRKRADTIEMAFQIENKRLKLGYLYELLFDEVFENAHSAKADTLATLRCYKELKRLGY